MSTDVEVAQRVFGESYPLAARYVEILASKGLEWGLLGPREVPRLWERHVLNSVAIADLIPRDGRLVDVGSGAGLPGIPLAVLRPDLDVTLLEPLQRRSTFLEETVADLGLEERVRVVRARAEEHRETYDVATSRAVAAVAKLVGWTAHLVPDGVIVALKGENVQAEIDAAMKVLRKARLVASVSQVRADPETEPTRALVVRRA